MDEVDPVSLRHQNPSTAGFDLFAQEEASADPELDHAPENFGWLAIDPLATTLGLLPLFNEPPSIVNPLAQSDFRDDVMSLRI